MFWQQVRAGTVKYGGEQFIILRARHVCRELQATWGLAETGQTGPSFLRVTAKGPFSDSGVSAFPEGGGQARCVIAVSSGEHGEAAVRHILAEAEKGNRGENMFTFAERALLLLEGAIAGKMPLKPVSYLNTYSHILPASRL